MPEAKDPTSGTILGLFFIQRYRFLTVDQFARAAGLKRETAANQLRLLGRCGLLDHFGNTGVPGFGKTPKVYCLTRKGFDVLLEESEIPSELLGVHRDIHVRI